MLALFLEHVVAIFDLRVRPATKTTAALRALFHVALITAAVAYGRAVVRPVSDAPRPIRVPAPTDTTRFGLTEDERRALFVDLVRDAERDRREAVALFHGHEWSGEDERTNRISRRIDAMGTRRSSSVLHLILDEGIRSGWPDATGEPVRATTPPLNPRTE
jgi:hypothetical protein